MFCRCFPVSAAPGNEFTRLALQADAIGLRSPAIYARILWKVASPTIWLRLIPDEEFEESAFNGTFGSCSGTVSTAVCI